MIENIGTLLNAPGVFAQLCGFALIMFFGYWWTFKVFLVNRIGIEEIVISTILVSTTRLVVGAFCKDNHDSCHAWKIILDELVEIEREKTVFSLNQLFVQLDIVLTRKLYSLDIRDQQNYQRHILAIDFLSQWTMAMMREVAKHRLGGEYRIRVRCITSSVQAALKEYL